MFKVVPTNYLAMKYSDDEGDNWSDLNIVSTFKPEESKFLVLGPGIGKANYNRRECRKIDCAIIFKIIGRIGLYV